MQLRSSNHKISRYGDKDRTNIKMNKEKKKKKQMK